MEMVRHYDEFVKQICAFIATSKNSLDQQFRGVWHSEKFTSLPCGGRNKVGSPRSCPMGQLAHLNFRG